eukprot:687437_1
MDVIRPEGHKCDDNDSMSSTAMSSITAGTPGRADTITISNDPDYLPAVQLYWDVESVGIHGMWLERYNSKAGIMSGDKHRYNLGVEKLKYTININEMAPPLQQYDIRIPILKLAINARMSSLDVNTASQQDWCRGVFVNNRKRENKYFGRKLDKYLKLKQ